MPNGSPSGCVNFLALSTRNQTQHPAPKAKGRRCHRVTSESGCRVDCGEEPTNWKVFLPCGLFGFVWSVRCVRCMCVCVCGSIKCWLLSANSKKHAPTLVYKVQGTSHCVDNLWAWSWKFLIRGQWFTFAKRISAKFHCRLRSKSHNLAYAQCERQGALCIRLGAKFEYMQSLISQSSLRFLTFKIIWSLCGIF